MTRRWRWRRGAMTTCGIPWNAATAATVPDCGTTGWHVSVGRGAGTWHRAAACAHGAPARHLRSSKNAASGNSRLARRVDCDPGCHRAKPERAGQAYAGTPTTSMPTCRYGTASRPSCRRWSGTSSSAGRDHARDLHALAQRPGLAAAAGDGRWRNARALHACTAGAAAGASLNGGTAGTVLDERHAGAHGWAAMIGCPVEPDPRCCTTCTKSTAPC